MSEETNPKLPLSIAETATLYQATRDPAHDFDHVLRVHNLAREIGEAEGARLRILLTAALLHDIGRQEQEADSTVDHAQVGSIRARELLSSETNDFVDAVAQAIAAHSMRGGPKFSTAGNTGGQNSI